jgi:hypothetical protein
VFAGDIALTVVSKVPALVAIAEWRRVLGARAWWARALLLTWASTGVVFSGHNGATLIYLHGGAVAPVTAAKAATARP